MTVPLSDLLGIARDATRVAKNAPWQERAASQRKGALDAAIEAISARKRTLKEMLSGTYFRDQWNPNNPDLPAAELTMPGFIGGPKGGAGPIYAIGTNRIPTVEAIRRAKEIVGADGFRDRVRLHLEQLGEHDLLPEETASEIEGVARYIVHEWLGRVRGR